LSYALALPPAGCRVATGLAAPRRPAAGARARSLAASARWGRGGSRRLVLLRCNALAAPPRATRTRTRPRHRRAKMPAGATVTPRLPDL